MHTATDCNESMPLKVVLKCWLGLQICVISVTQTSSELAVTNTWCIRFWVNNRMHTSLVVNFAVAASRVKLSWVQQML